MKILHNILKNILTIFFLLTLIECNHSTKNLAIQLKIAPPFKKASVQGEQSKINPAEAITLTTMQGTEVYIPASAFVFENGETVRDSVNIKISEYRTAAEILMSGIPMKCDSAGQTYNFESAGMFEIRGDCEGKEVFLNKGKSIDVDFVSIASGNYDFYFFNEELGKWENSGTLKSDNNKTAPKADTASKDLTAEKTAIKKIVEPKKIDNKKSVIDFDINLKNFPEINIYNGIVWQYSDNKNYKDPDNNKWIFSTKWENFDLTPLNDSTEYLLKLSTKSKSFTTSVVPVLNEKNYNKAITVFRKNMDALKEQLTNAKEEIERQLKEGEVLRAFSINQMGIYNWDRMYKEPRVITLAADFSFDKYTLNDFNDITVFFITDNGRTVVKLPESDWEKFAFNPEKENKILAVLPEDQVACYSSGDFRNLDVDNIKSSGSFTFKLKVSDKKITSSESLNEFLNSI